MAFNELTFPNRLVGIKPRSRQMSFDEVLTVEALNLADGSDIHNVAGMVGIYRSLDKEDHETGAIAELEAELRKYIARKRIKLTLARSFVPAVDGFSSW
jgi:hypothetical protein